MPDRRNNIDAIVYSLQEDDEATDEPDPPTTKQTGRD